MIHAALTDANRYASLHPDFAKCFAFLANFDPNLPPGRHDIAGTNSYALIQHYETAAAADKKLEAHRAAIDIQFLARGCETLQVSPPRNHSPSTDYIEKDDYQLFQDAEGLSECKLEAGEFAIFFPEDHHKPGCVHGDSPAPVVKVVIKVPC